MRLSQEPCLGVKGELKSAGGLLGQPSSGFPRDMRGMIVEDQMDCRVGRIGRIEELEKLDELPAPMAILHQGMNLAGQQVDTGQQADRAVALVFVVAREGRMNCGSGGKSGVVVAIAWMPGFSS